MAEKGKKEQAHGENSALRADCFRIALNAAARSSVANGGSPAVSGDERRSWALRGRSAQAAAMAFWSHFPARATGSVRRVQVDG